MKSSVAGPAEPPTDRLRLTREGLAWLAAALVLGGIGWLKSLNQLLLVAETMAALLLLNGLLAHRHARRVTAARAPLPPVHAGDTVPFRVAVENPGRRPATVGVADLAVTWHLDQLPPGAATECAAVTTFTRRGRAHAGPLVWSDFPFGFIRADCPNRATVEVVVLPALGRVDADGLRRWMARQAGGEGRARRVLRRMTSDQADVRGVRPYRPGDGLRTVHWRSSAHRGKLMVREYDVAPAPELVLVVDPFLPADPTPHHRAALEAALSLAATLVRAVCHPDEARVTVVVAGATAVVARGPSAALSAYDAMIPLADVAGGPEVPVPDPGAFGRGLGRAVRVVVSSRRDSPLAVALTRATGKPFTALDPDARLPWYQPPRARP